ncbi:MAG: hypothetical protein KGH71_06450, partial [Candidatus Micrarchaeota archaeon]|nr:hypothetical protein [Candidatus Micrarchaeota archaeon]
MTLEFGKKSDLSELKRNSDRCPECRKGSITEDEHTGERVCMDCGVVLQENLESKQLPMIPHSTPMASSSSILELYSKDSSGKQVPVAVRQSFQRLSRFNIASDSSKVAREKRVNAILEGLCDKLGLPKQV